MIEVKLVVTLEGVRELCLEQGIWKATKEPDKAPFLDLEGGFQGICFIIVHCAQCLLCVVFGIYILFYNRKRLPKKKKLTLHIWSGYPLSLKSFSGSPLPTRQSQVPNQGSQGSARSSLPWRGEETAENRSC